MSDQSIQAPNTYPHPRPCVGGVVFRGDTILLIQRGREPRKGQWSIPGGKIEKGETLQQALVREIREETGVVVNPGPLIDVLDMIRGDIHYVLIDYICDAPGTEPPIAGDDAQDAGFYPLDEALEKVDWGETRRILEMAIAIKQAETPDGR